MHESALERAAAWFGGLPLLAKLLILAGLAGAVLLPIGLLTGGQGSGAPAAQSPAQRLAAAQEGGSPASDDPLVQQFQTELTSLAMRCQEGEAGLAVATVVAHDDLVKNGVDEAYLSVLTHVEESVPASASGFDCKGAFAAYEVLREKS